MITCEPTKNLSGIIVRGTMDDFEELVDSIHRMAIGDVLEKPKNIDYYYEIKNRLLGLCYDIRKAAMGHRDVELVDVHFSEFLNVYNKNKLPKKEIYFSFNIIITEALFLALAVPEIYQRQRLCYSGFPKSIPPKYNLKAPECYLFYKDRALINSLLTKFLVVIGKILGEEEFYKLYSKLDYDYMYIFHDYFTPYVDKCNLEYLNTPYEKRKTKLKHIMKRFMRNNESYISFKNKFEYLARIDKCNVNDLSQYYFIYPYVIEW
ncbi:MAG: DUF6904 family protein [Bacillales bacterium]